MTLTVPHSGDVARDATTLREAWPRFLRQLQRHLAIDRGAPRLQYWRAREETPGTNGNGHVHWHILIVMPFIHHAILRLHWARALPADYRERLPVHTTEDVVGAIDSPVLRERVQRGLVTRRGPHGRPLAEIAWPVIDVRGAADYHRSARAGRATKQALTKMVAEAAKYVTKDVDYMDAAGHRRLVDPAVFSRLYAATDGQRRTACTMSHVDRAGHLRAGWWIVEKLAPWVWKCECCGHNERAREVYRLSGQIRAP